MTAKVFIQYAQYSSAYYYSKIGFCVRYRNWRTAYSILTKFSIQIQTGDVHSETSVLLSNGVSSLEINFFVPFCSRGRSTLHKTPRSCFNDSFKFWFYSCFIAFGPSTKSNNSHYGFRKQWIVLSRSLIKSERRKSYLRRL